MHREMLTYGLKEGTTDVLLHIDAVHKGKECGCVCPNCKHKLVAKNGGKGGPRSKTHHFAHANGSEECGKGKMTALHILAQKILEERKTILLPEYHKQFVHKEAQSKIFDNVTLEEFSKVEDVVLRPDCVCRKEDSSEPLWVEIYCRHRVDYDKRDEIKYRGKYCVEVDFRDLLNTDYKESDVVARLESDSSHKEWICCPAWDKKEEQERLKAQAEWEEQQRIEAEERQKELERIKAEREHDEYLEQLANEWHSNPDQNIVNTIIQEIKQYPYDFIDKSMYIHLVPWQAWLREFTRFPRNDKGLQVFYCLIRYYYNSIKLDDRRHIRWKVLDTPMWKLINQKERSDEDEVLLEYMIVIWAINLLNNHKRYSDHDSELAKVFSKKANVRKGLMDIMLQGGDRSRFLEEDVREKIRQEFGDREDGETIVQIFEICFPINLKKDVEPSQPTVTIESGPQLYGHDKILAEHHMAETEAWAELNRLFKEQEDLRRNNN